MLIYVKKYKQKLLVYRTVFCSFFVYTYKKALKSELGRWYNDRCVGPTA